MGFNIEMWNVNGRINDDLPKTNNSIEGWHNAFNKRVGITHPTPRKLFLKIRNEMSDFELLVEQHRLGMIMPQPAKRYRDSSDRIRGIVNNFDFSVILLFLRTIVHNI